MIHVALHAQPAIPSDHLEAVAQATMRALNRLADGQDAVTVSMLPQHETEVALLLELFGIWQVQAQLSALVLLRDGDDIIPERGWSRQGRKEFYRLLTTVNWVFFYDEREDARLPLLDWRMRHASHLVLVRESANTAFCSDFLTAAIATGKPAVRVDPISHRATKFTN